ncbi:MAG: hypothetical protein ISS25_04265 [Nanoarchaeota archaeon]|nr:hypothetical protein [Nanoarchaeota archaeon]
MKMSKKSIIEKILFFLFLILAIIFIIQLTLKLLRDSPTDFQVLYVGFGVVVSYLLIMSFKIGMFVGKVNEFMKITNNSFKKLSRDISNLSAK